MSGKTTQIRNLALIGHGGCGKTSLAEALLFGAGATSRLGKVDDGSSVLDYEPEEIKRKITISSAFHHYQWKKYTVYLADTPGDDNFLADTRAALHVADAAVVVVDAVDGVKVGTEKVWHTANRYNLPRLVFINKMDRERADFHQALKEVREVLEVQAVPILLPIGREAGFKGVVDLIGQKAYVAAAGGGKLEAVPIPDDLKDEVEALRGDLLNFAAESDDALIEKFLEEGELTPEEIYQGLRVGTLKGNFVPVLCGASSNSASAALLLDAINLYLPAPEDRGQIMGTASQHGSRSGFCGGPGWPPGGAGLQDRGRPLCRPPVHLSHLLRRHGRRLHRHSTPPGRCRNVSASSFCWRARARRRCPAWAPGPSARWPNSRRPSPAIP